MGDVTTHGKITHFVVGTGRAADTAGAVPVDDWDHLELGNYLTDVSQFRDPPAHHSGRGQSEWKVVAKTFETTMPWWWLVSVVAGQITVGAVGMNEDADDESWRLAIGGLAGGMLGGVAIITGFAFSLAHWGWSERIWGEKDDENPHGDLAEFFRLVNLGIAHSAYTEAGQDATAAWVASESPVAIDGTTDLPDGIPRVTTAQLDAIFTESFTQYWPHEHLDFPYVEDAEDHAADPRFVPGSRGVMEYLEQDIVALAQQLSDLERRWVTAVAAGDADRAAMVVELGHQLHAVEDYWFHSNFVESLRWARVRAASPGLDPDVEADREALLAAALADGGVADSTKMRRTLQRRLRYPVYDGDELSDLDDEESIDGTSRVFTGGFGSTDIWHTLGKALENMETGHATGLLTRQLAGSGLTLFELLFREAERVKMVREEAEADRGDDHAKELEPQGDAAKGQVFLKLDKLHDAGHLCDRAHEAFTAAFEVDRAAEASMWKIPGVGGFLIQLLGMMQEERTNDAVAVQRLEGWVEGVLHPDIARDSILERASTNGASSENIGTHSLMAKDSPTSEPFRHDAVRLAKHASASIARRMVQRLGEDPDPAKGVDWLAWLQHFLPFPAAGTGWWSQLVDGPLTGAEDQPAVETVADTLPSSVLLTAEQLLFALRSPDADGDGNMDARTKVLELEAYYDSFQK